MNSFINRFKHIPIGCTGVGLGIGGLGSLYTILIQYYNTNNNWGLTLPIITIVQDIFIFFTICFLGLVLLRNITHKHTFSNEIKHPLLASFIPTIFMSTMVISGFIASLADVTGIYEFKYVGVVIWYLAVIGQLTILTLFIINVVKKHKIKSDSLYASWFVPPVGIIVACTVAGSFTNMITPWIPIQLFEAIWFFGFSLYIVILPIVSYKLLFHRNEDKNTFPSIAIYGAPANLSLAGFLSVFVKKENDLQVAIDPYPQTFINAIVFILMFMSIATTLVVYLVIPRIFSVRFNPTYASLTFPLAIGSTAIFKSYLYLSSNYLVDASNLVSTLISIVKYVAYVELAIATIVVLYVLIRYVILIIKKLTKQPGIVWKANLM